MSAGKASETHMRNISALSPHDGLNFSKKAEPLKPGAGSDFRQQLEASMGAASRGELRPLTPADMMSPIKGPVVALQPLNPPPLALKPLGDSPFSLGRPKEPKSEHEKLQETARKLVAQTFFGPMLKQMRDSPFKSKLFSGGRGGEAFSSMLDQKLAEHMARGADSKLVRSITRKLEGKASYQKQQSLPKAAAPANNPYQNVRMHVAPGLRA